MKTPRFFTTLAFIAFTSIAIAQTDVTASGNDPRNALQIGVKGGINYSGLYDAQGQNFVDNYLFGPVFGGFLSIPLGTYLGLQPEVLYSAKGFSSTGTTIDGSQYSFIDRMNFLDIPIMLQVKPSPYLYLLGGVEYSYLLSRDYTFTNGVTSETTQQDFQNDNINHNVFGIIFGIDVNFTNWLTLGVRAAWDLQDNNGNGTSSLPRYRNVWEQATLGFRF